MDTRVPSPPYHRLTRPDVTDQSARFRKFFLTAPDLALRFKAERAFVGQGAASGAVRPAPAIRRHKRRDSPRLSAVVANGPSHGTVIGITSRGAP
jgi:hypothetical protein